MSNKKQRDIAHPFFLHNFQMDALRKYRLNILSLDISAIDLLGTLGISYYVAHKLNLNKLLFVSGSIPLSVAVHKYFNIDTTLTNKYDDINDPDQHLHAYHFIL